MLHSAVLYSEEEGKGLEGSISFIALLIFNRSIVLVLRLFCLFACLLLCVHKEVARNAPALHAGPRAFFTLKGYNVLAKKASQKNALPYGRFAEFSSPFVFYF